MPDFRVVDLGTKQGGAAAAFLRLQKRLFPEDRTEIRPEQCLCVDKQTTYGKHLRSKGFGFLQADLAEPAELLSLPQADYYLAWDFLEHLPNTDVSSAVLAIMLERAKRGVCLRLPSFEPDSVTGEGRLKLLGLRFAWTTWQGHKSHYCLQHVDEAVLAATNRNARSYLLETHPSRLIHDTTDPGVVPLDADTEAVRYDSSMPHKAAEKFRPPVVGQWEITISPKP